MYYISSFVTLILSHRAVLIYASIKIPMNPFQTEPHRSQTPQQKALTLSKGAEPLIHKLLELIKVYKNQRAYLAIPVSDIKGLMILKNVLSCFKPSYHSVQISTRFLKSLDPLALGPSGPHASGSKLHILPFYDNLLLSNGVSESWVIC